MNLFIENLSVNCHLAGKKGKWEIEGKIRISFDPFGEAKPCL